MPRYFPATPPGDIEPDQLKVYLDQEFRKVANAQVDEDLEGRAVLFRTTDNILPTDALEAPLVNYSDSFSNSVLDVVPILGTITMPPLKGVVDVNCWVSLEQVTNVRDFTVQLKLEVGGVFVDPVLAAGYLPQQGSDVRLGLSCSFVRSISGGEVLRLGCILDNANSAEFQIIDSTFEVRYLTVRG